MRCAIVRVDPAPGFKALKGDPILRKCRIELDVGGEKDVNKRACRARFRRGNSAYNFHDAIITEINQLAIITARLDK